LFVGGPDASQQEDFNISRKPAHKVLAMRQLVHDTDYDPAELYAAGWPLRWRAATAGNEDPAWQVETTVDGINVRQRYLLAGRDGAEAWLRYEHIVPDYYVWRRLEALQAEAAPGVQPALTAAERERLRPRLITDANPYNAREDLHHLHYPPRVVSDRESLEIDLFRQGIHWVGDLIVEADVDVQQPGGELMLDLVEAGRHFQATIELSTGAVTLSAEGAANYAPTGKTSIHGPGEYRIAFGNVDDQLLLWVDGDLIQFEGGTTYDAREVFGDRRGIQPQATAQDPGDLAPAGIGGRDATLAVGRLRVWRDIYYIADNAENNESRIGNLITDFEQPNERVLIGLPYDPSLWEAFAARRHVDFRLGADQFFVMGDNSAESSDARLWYNEAGVNMGRAQPGGSYLERKLLIGKALCVYWPHSWHRIPGTPIPFPLFPNFQDMRLVR
jgi:signal peptidase I